MAILRCLWAFYQGLKNIMVISIKSTDQIFHLSTFSDSNTFMTEGPGQAKCKRDISPTMHYLKCDVVE